MRNIMLVAATFVTAACVSGAPGDRASTQQTVSIGSADNSVNERVLLTRDHYVGEAEIAGSREAVWSAVPDAFDEVGLPAPVLDEQTWTATLRNHVVRRRLGSQRLSALLECGRGMTQPHADSHRIFLTVSVRLEEGSDPDVTAVRTRVEAVGENPEGTTTSVTCSSRGRLEPLLANALQLQVLER